MPTVSLRLTEEELLELREWAHRGRRSLQKEIVWRLFSAEAVLAPKYGPATEEPREAVSVPVGSTGVLEGRGAKVPPGGSGNPTREGVADPPRPSSAGCGMDTPPGVKCKFCGKVH